VQLVSIIVCIIVIHTLSRLATSLIPHPSSFTSMVRRFGAISEESEMDILISICLSLKEALERLHASTLFSTRQ
jgi:hypothetical protein